MIPFLQGSFRQLLLRLNGFMLYGQQTFEVSPCRGSGVGWGGVGCRTDCCRLLNSLEPKLGVLLVTFIRIPYSGQGWGIRGGGIFQGC